jgi:heterotetrameric sarcosine oxidase gamma subunit
VTLGFLSPVASQQVPASSPLEPWLSAAGARLEVRDGWRVATSFGDVPAEVAACREGIAVSDRSAMGKLELQARPDVLEAALERVAGDAPPAGGSAALDDGFLWRSSPDRALAVCEPAAGPRLLGLLEEACERAGPATLVDLTAGLVAIELSGPRALELLERLTALDVRPAAFAPGEARAGEVARVPAALARTEDEGYLVLVSSPQAPDAWELVLDVGAGLGARLVGEEARARAGRSPQGVRVRA